MDETKKPGWYDDPTRAGRLRWWRGDAWADIYQHPDRGVPSPIQADDMALPVQEPRGGRRRLRLART